MINTRVTNLSFKGQSRTTIAYPSSSSPNQKTIQLEAYEFDYQGSFLVLLGETLLKKTLNTSWSQRYFLLTPTRLMYFSDSTMKDLKGCFSLVSLIEHRLKVRSAQNTLSLEVWIEEGDQNQKTLLQLKIEDRRCFLQWKEQLTKVVHNLEAIRKEERMLFPIIRQEQLLASNFKLGKMNCNFWNDLQISPHELNKYASHLDILLLRSRNPLCCLHRFFMRSHYDHIAFLIKDQSQKVFLVEAVQSLGVCMTSLESIMANLVEEYEEIGYRRLIIKDQDSFQVQKLEEYINKTLGSHYQLSLTKLFIDNESIPDEITSEEGEGGVKSHCKGEGDMSVQDTGKKTYFCSQLVADIYLRFGILTQGKSNNYWPKDFEQDNIIFSQGYSLGPLMKVQLDQLLDLSDQSQL